MLLGDYTIELPQSRWFALDWWFVLGLLGLTMIRLVLN